MGSLVPFSVRKKELQIFDFPSSLRMSVSGHGA